MSIIARNVNMVNTAFGVVDPTLDGVGVWYDASNPLTMTKDPITGKVSQLNDLSGNGYHLTQGLLLNAPTFNETTFEGRPGIDFLDTDMNHLQRDMAGTFLSDPSITEAITIIFVFTKLTKISTRSMLGSGGSANSRGIDVFTFSLQSAIRVSADSGNYTEWDYQNFVNTVPQILTFDMDGTYMHIWNNGAPRGTILPNAITGSDTITNFVIGARPTGTNPLPFTLGEFQAYPTVLTNQQRNRQQQRLARKYGITIV